MIKTAITSVIFLTFIFTTSLLQGQEKYAAIKVYAENSQQLSFPWAGGMNACQFSKLDINLDGLKDLIVFDRTGDRIMPFLAVQSGETFDYAFAPEYEQYFPELTQWAIFIDYNGDGKEDIFTYSPGYAGLKVYRNTSLTYLDFRLQVYPFLTSFQGGGYVNILLTYADYPAIYDLDEDGDLDILTFWGLGSFVEKHRNMSVEKYGNSDSLDFMKTEYCWGYFAESEESNQLTLDTCLRSENSYMKDRHTGSTFRLLDLNGDHLTDLLLGDVDFPNLVALYNKGSIDTARIESYEWQYPVENQPVSMFSMPASFYDDVDFDGINDLVVSPFDPNPFMTGNFESIWFYHNDGSNDHPQFDLKTRSFFQNQMIDVGAGAYPVFCDADQDGLMDLLIGNFGYYDTSYYDQYMVLHTEQLSKIAYLRNSGTADHPAFNFIDRDFAGASVLDLKGLVPTFGDLDGDNDDDMLLGCEDGTIISYINTAGHDKPMNLVLSQLNLQGIDIGAFSTPQLFDLDRDNLKDLIIGEKGGNINFYRNTGTAQKPVFTPVTDSLGKVNVTDYTISLDGCSVPCFYRDELDRTHLLVGSEQGDVLYYTGIDDNLVGSFTLSDTLAGLIGLQEIKTGCGYRSAPALFDLDQNGHPELIAGNFSGGLEYFTAGGFPPVSGLDENNISIPEVAVYPVPVTNQMNIRVTDPEKWSIVSVTILTTDGRTIQTYDCGNNNKMSINVNALLKGVHILRISLKDKITNHILPCYKKTVTVF